MAEPKTSALPPPLGGDQHKGWQVLVVHSILLGIGIILLIARLYVRKCIVRNVGMDDYLISLGVLSTTASMIIAGWQIQWGFGRHMYYLLQTPQSHEQLKQSNKISTILQFITVFDLFFIKFSIGLFLLRLFGSKKSCRRIIWIINVFVTLATFINAITLIAQCQPLKKVWDPQTPGRCWSPEVNIRVGYYNGATSVFSDWALSTVPIVGIWSLQMSATKKVGIAAIMGLGYFTGATAIVRCVLMSNLAGDDVTWDAVPLSIWAGTETRLGIIGACIPTLKPLFNSTTRRSMKSRRRVFGPKQSLWDPPSERIYPFNKARIVDQNSISEVLKGCEDDVPSTVNQTTGRLYDGRGFDSAINVKTEFALEVVTIPDRSRDS